MKRVSYTKTRMVKRYRILKLEEGRGDMMELTTDMAAYQTLKYCTFETEEEAEGYLIDHMDDIGFSGEFIVVPTYTKEWDYEDD